MVLIPLFESLDAKLASLKNEIAICAQKVYDEWDQDDDGIDDIYGSGGICDEIADEICNVLLSYDIECTTQYNEYDFHTSVYALDRDTHKCYHVDIHPSHYETGAAYTWKKIPNVTIKPDMVSIEETDWENFFGENGEH